MLKKVITYTDYDGNERTESFYFNLNEAELIEMELSAEGGLTQMIQKIVESKDGTRIIKVFKDLIFKAYGEKSPDGKKFVKSEELSKNFSYTEAYNKLFMELATDEKAAADFVNGIIPAKSSSEPAALSSNLTSIK